MSATAPGGIAATQNVPAKTHSGLITIGDVFATDELAKRTPKKIDYLQEKRALQELAIRMVDQPDEILPKFVELAMDMVEGASAGLSLFEPDPSPGVFRWQHLHGRLSPFEGATTPRDHSPCGVTLDRKTAVLSVHPERVYGWIADVNIVVPEVLLVPLYIDGAEPLGTLWIVSDVPGHFDGGHARALTELATFVGIAIRIQRTERHLHKALDEQETVAREMNHRIKNLFMIVDGMVRSTARTASDTKEMAADLSGRLHALASAHSLVRRVFSDVGTAPPAADLGELIRAVIRPYESRSGSRFRINGPPICIGDRATNGVALVIHEFATNASKYGALTVEDGGVDVCWLDSDGTVTLTWIERGGPPVLTVPPSSGFGSQLAHATIVRQFGGTLNYCWDRPGLMVTITLPRSSLSD
jgi:two-component sensor histidine kinase